MEKNANLRCRSGKGTSVPARCTNTRGRSRLPSSHESNAKGQASIHQRVKRTKTEGSNRRKKCGQRRRGGGRKESAAGGKKVRGRRENLPRLKNKSRVEHRAPRIQKETVVISLCTDEREKEVKAPNEEGRGRDDPCQPK